MCAGQFGAIKVAPRLHRHSQADHERQAAAAAARQAEEEQQRAVRQRRLRGTSLSLLLDEESDVFADWEGYADLDGRPQPASSQQRTAPAGSQQQCRSHTENVRRREEAWRAVDQHDIAVSVV